MSVVLWHIEISHYNEKARWALDYKRIPYELRTPMPGTHRLSALRLTRGKHERLPVIDIDGERTWDSTAIIAALERYRPEPALYPADAADRERALEIEDHFDEELAPRVRRLIWHYTLPDTDATVAAVIPDGGDGAVRTIRRGMMRATAPVASRLVRRDYDVDQASADEAAAGVRAAMDRLESELGDGDYLVGDGFTVADLTAAALFTPLIAPEGRPWAPKLVPALQPLRDELEARPGGRFVHRMYEQHRGVPVAA